MSPLAQTNEQRPLLQYKEIPKSLYRHDRALYGLEVSRERGEALETEVRGMPDLLSSDRLIVNQKAKLIEVTNRVLPDS